MSATPIGGGFNFNIVLTSGTWRWVVSASTLQGPGQTYQVQDIVTPYGPMSMAAIPLPSGVVEAMADSIASVRDQMKPKMTLVSTQTLFSTGITEGDPRKGIGCVQVRNDGGFGSYLSAVATPDVPWLTVLTPQVSGIPRGEIASFSIDLVPDNMLASQSPYVGHVRIQDASDPSLFAVVTVNVAVIPRPQISVSANTVALTWSASAPATSVAYVNVSNSGPGSSVLNFSTQRMLGVTWLNVAPESGGPLSPGDFVSLAFSTLGASMPTSLGEHVETVRILSPNASNFVDVTVILTVTI